MQIGLPSVNVPVTPGICGFTARNPVKSVAAGEVVRVSGNSTRYTYILCLVVKQGKAYFYVVNRFDSQTQEYCTTSNPILRIISEIDTI